MLFSQDFNIWDILRLWDLIFSVENVYYYTYYISLAVMEIKKEKLLKCDMVDFMVEIQNFENLEIDDILNCVHDIKNKYEKEFLKIICKNKIEYNLSGRQIIYKKKVLN